MIKSIQLKFKGQKITIEYISVNNKCKDVILFLHGLGASKEDFYDIMNNPKFSDYNMVGFDFPGTNQSTYIEKLDINDLIEITNLFVEKMGFSGIILIGHSMGGVVGLKFAERFISKVTAGRLSNNIF